MSESNLPYLVLAYYKFITIENPLQEIEDHKFFFENLEATGRIYISEEGINGQMSGSYEVAQDYMKWLKDHPLFSTIHFKIHTYHENIFPRMTIKYRKQLVALDKKVNLENRGKHLSPKEWKETLEKEEDILLIDVRNDYEWKVGHFEKANLPPLETFRDFPKYAEELTKEYTPQKKILMYCTGGIRCELYSALLKEKGFEEVYQLEGGIINYGLEEGSSHWKGKLFVFDDRLAVPIDPHQQDEEPISHCTHCHLPCDVYHNCANMDCNELFFCCESCLHLYMGCCQFICKNAPRLRSYRKNGSNRPFRRQHIESTSTDSD